VFAAPRRAEASKGADVEGGDDAAAGRASALLEHRELAVGSGVGVSQGTAGCLSSGVSREDATKGGVTNGASGGSDGVVDGSGDCDCDASCTQPDDKAAVAAAVTSEGSSTLHEPPSAPSPLAVTTSPARRQLLHAVLYQQPIASVPRSETPCSLHGSTRVAPADPLLVEELTLLQVFLGQLRAAVDLTARIAGAQAVRFSCVRGAQGLITVEAGDPIATWTLYKDGILLALCICAGVLGLGRSFVRGLPMEFSQIQAALSHSCTCRHALALLRAYDELGYSVGAVNLSNLFLSFPALRGPLTDDGVGGPVGTLTNLVMNSEKRNNVPFDAAFYNDAWATVVVRPTSNKFKLATCCQMLCQTRPWGCIHEGGQ